jgi:hypothetical protein
MPQDRGSVMQLILEASDRYGLLGREVPVRLLNFSASGCLLQSAASLEPQWVGRLKVAFDGEQFADDVRVTRCQQVPGAGAVFNVGVEFVLTSHATRGSLRRFLRSRFVLPTLSGQSPVEGREVWANGQPNGTRGAPPRRRPEQVDV